MNKNIFFIMLICTLSGCSNSETEIATPMHKEAEIPSPGYFDLSEYGLPLSMDIGPKIKTDFQVEWNDTFGRLEIKNGEGIHFFVIQDTITCATKRVEIESGIFSINYIVENDEVIFYEATLPYAMSSYYHFFACLQIDGKIYNFENNPLIEFRKSDIEEMVELSRSFKAVDIDKI